MHRDVYIPHRDVYEVHWDVYDPHQDVYEVRWDVYTPHRDVYKVRWDVYDPHRDVYKARWDVYDPHRDVYEAQNVISRLVYQLYSMRVERVRAQEYADLTGQGSVKAEKSPYFTGGFVGKP